MRIASCFVLLFIVVFTGSSQHKIIQFDSERPYENNDSLGLVILENVKIPTKTILDDFLRKEFNIAAIDYFYYYGSYKYMLAAKRRHPAIISTLNDVFIPINNEKKLCILINGRSLLSEIFENFSRLSKIKEIDGYKIENDDVNRVTIKFNVNEKFKGTEYEIPYYSTVGPIGPMQRTKPIEPIKLKN